MNETILLFQSTRAVIKAESLLNATGIACTVIPVPKQFSSECGMAIVLQTALLARVNELLEKERIAVKTHSLTSLKNRVLLNNNVH
ncbi:MAG: hypothetical protein A2268_14490 [Candidatus Raymondbacteria bacterium RifOxyA12_full_50_37]|uniref:Putative Se/S carrier protein-like domain-containing protein n=1 Tax=Candidatus Raymondbacteria bacterium RIFOXYD12_FULL_49_13 TaxID=1817890 RepID=A0A1F7F2D8_UNCRA|nr:MAG: hypothetical protein A2268_14490 [Candidatus Raymondbacteria bacterium RifOxyA12_full_50_37]OGJ88628.1 MAG: hypothetical protein A2248_20425 [Candidatus Raymondbacteria bacterium RIFOXYA2_FULL_49_16]OGK00801.1 MAG: hypothetical protein A2519_07680 [Candidatus Raymondbacteria bacterium RIFOXYD12_FULL_49_13]OGK02896.1 MAG: hypothetical protein A2487_17885 [Candidatus Raymondbacteria bacterium RifOxyC12_full_50_8]OGK02946.1 MAG: hypothetical protein A2350_20055 [Candidatus Raymondbacteria 